MLTTAVTLKRGWLVIDLTCYAVEGNSEPVGFGFYIYSKEIERTEAEIQAAMATEDYDEHQAVPADEPVYDSVRIAVKGGLQIGTDVG